MKLDLPPLQDQWTPESLGGAVQRPLDLLASELGCVFWLTGRDGRQLLYVTPSCEQLWGTRAQDLYENPMALLECIHPDDRARAARAMKRGTGGASLEYRVIRRDGSVRWILERMREVRGPDGKLAYFGGLASDITESKRAEACLKRSNRLLLAIGAISQSLLRREGEDRLAQTACAALLEPGGYRSAWIGFVLGGDPASLRCVAHCRIGATEAAGAIGGGAAAVSIAPQATQAVRSAAVQVLRPDSWTQPAGEAPGTVSAAAQPSLAFVPLIDESGVLGVVCVESLEADCFDTDEISLLRELAARIAFGVALQRSNVEHERALARVDRLALFDALTELPNRLQLLQDIANVSRQCASDGAGFSLLSVDVSRIESLRTSLGFGASDALAMSVAARLKDLCTEQELVARLEGGEFAIRLDPENSGRAEQALARARDVRTALDAPCHVGTTEVLPHAVIGIAMFPGDGVDAATLLERAQKARISADGGDGSDISFFGPQRCADAMRELELEAALRRAPEAGELSLVYQPEVDLASGEIVCVEALLRWNSSRFGSVSPVEFVPLAERSDLILAIGEWVLREACRQAVAWRALGAEAPRIAVNLSSRQIAQAGFAGSVHAITLECGADPSWLGLEITESMLISDGDNALHVLRSLKALGFEISLDDFGTGYSSLSRLQEMPIDIVKIDRVFVPDVTAAPEGVSVTRAIITMTHSLQMRVLAEGVETEGQLRLLAAHGCDLVQGFFFSRPVSASAIEQMVRDRRRLDEEFLARSRGGRTLLLVDDEEVVLSSLQHLLRQDGYRIICARSAEEGLLRLAESQVDVIVSDQRMPGMTGVEFLRRAKDLYPNTVRMVLSGFVDQQSIIDAVNEGAIYKFLTKPWDGDRLQANIAEAFRKKEMSDENRRLAREVEDAKAGLERLNFQLHNALAQNSSRSDILQRTADTAREILDAVPAAIVGIDAEGVIAYVNGGASDMLPGLPAMLGLPMADALPAALLSMLAGTGVSAGSVQVDDRHFHAVVRPLQASGADRGRLIVLLPIPAGQAAVTA